MPFSKNYSDICIGLLGIASLLFADDVLLLVSLSGDPQKALGQFEAGCPADGVRISNKKHGLNMPDWEQVTALSGGL